MKKRYNELFERLTPIMKDDELLSEVLGKEEKGMKKNVKFGKAVIIPLVAAALICLTGTTAAATGIIDFNDIFGTFFKAESNETANNLIAEQTGYKCHSENSDYKVSIKGITGTANDIDAVFLIERTDGKPVSDYLENTELIKENDLFPGAESFLVDGVKDINVGVDNTVAMITPEGNIEVNVKCRGENLAGKRISMVGRDFYSLYSILTDYDFIDKGIMQKMSAVWGCSGGLTDSDHAKLDEIKILSLGWSAEFVYTPTETAVISCVGDDLISKIFLNMTVEDIETEETSEKTFEASVTSVMADSKGARITFAVDIGEKYKVAVLPDMDIVFIKTDDTEIDTSYTAMSGSKENDDTFAFSRKMYYTDGANELSVNMNEIRAVRINGVTYELVPIE